MNTDINSRSIKLLFPKADAFALLEELPPNIKRGLVAIVVLSPAEFYAINQAKPQASIMEIFRKIQAPLQKMQFTSIGIKYAENLDHYRTFFLHIVSQDLVNIREAIRAHYELSSGIFNPDPTTLGHFFVYLGHEGTHAKFLAKPEHGYKKC